MIVNKTDTSDESRSWSPGVTPKVVTYRKVWLQTAPPYTVCNASVVASVRSTAGKETLDAHRSDRRRNDSVFFIFFIVANKMNSEWEKKLTDFRSYFFEKNN